MHNILILMYTVENFPILVHVLLYVVTMLIFQIKRIISSEKWFNYVVTFFSFCLKMPKIWVGRTTLNEGEKRGWPEPNSIYRGGNHHMYDFPMRDCTQEQNSSPYLRSSFGTIQMAVSVKKNYLDPKIFGNVTSHFPSLLGFG